jgi:uncharacterized protein
VAGARNTWAASPPTATRRWCGRRFATRLELSSRVPHRSKAGSGGFGLVYRARREVQSDRWLSPHRYFCRELLPASQRAIAGSAGSIAYRARAIQRPNWGDREHCLARVPRSCRHAFCGVLSSRPVKTSLDHLPEHKREQLRAIAEELRAQIEIEMLILFGSYARGDWVEDPENLYFSDYDLMPIVATPQVAQNDALWQRITAKLRQITGRIPITLLPHDIRQANHEIRIGQYFFADVALEGILLYDSTRFKLAKPKAQTPAKRLDLALYNFRYWFQSASGFWRGTGYYMAEGLYAHAAFLLHQATERYFHAVLLVFTGYKPKTHDIEELAGSTAALHEALVGALPRENKEDSRLFGLLKRAYIEARYSKSYRITLDELTVLRGHVLTLAGCVRRACDEKLRTIVENAEIGELPALPQLSDTFEFPQLPALDDPRAVEIWRDAIAQMAQERGEQRFREGRQLGERVGEEHGRQEGIREGEERGRQSERARAILDVLRRRGLTLSEAQVERIASCRDDQTLARWWDLAWSVNSVSELVKTRDS